MESLSLGDYLSEIFCAAQIEWEEFLDQVQVKRVSFVHRLDCELFRQWDQDDCCLFLLTIYTMGGFIQFHHC